MIKRRGHRFRVYPRPEQDTLFRRTSGCCRLVYNLCLEQMLQAMRRYGGGRRQWPTAFDQNNELKALKEELPFLRDVPIHALQQAVVDLHRAFANWREGHASLPTCGASR